MEKKKIYKIKESQLINIVNEATSFGSFESIVETLVKSLQKAHLSEDPNQKETALTTAKRMFEMAVEDIGGMKSYVPSGLEGDGAMY